MIFNLARKKNTKNKLLPFGISLSTILIIILAGLVIGLWINLSKTREKVKSGEKISSNYDTQPENNKNMDNKIKDLQQKFSSVISENERLKKEKKELNDKLIKKDEEIAELKIQLEIIEKTSKK